MSGKKGEKKDEQKMTRTWRQKQEVHGSLVRAIKSGTICLCNDALAWAFARRDDLRD